MSHSITSPRLARAVLSLRGSRVSPRESRLGKPIGALVERSLRAAAIGKFFKKFLKERVSWRSQLHRFLRCGDRSLQVADSYQKAAYLHLEPWVGRGLLRALASCLKCGFKRTHSVGEVLGKI